MLISVKSSSAIVPLSEFYVDRNGTISNQGFSSCFMPTFSQLPRTITNLRGIPSNLVADTLFVSNFLFKLNAMCNCKYNYATHSIFHISLPSHDSTAGSSHNYGILTLVRSAVYMIYISFYYCAIIISNIYYSTGIFFIFLVTSSWLSCNFLHPFVLFGFIAIFHC